MEPLLTCLGSLFSENFSTSFELAKAEFCSKLSPVEGATFVDEFEEFSN